MTEKEFETEKKYQTVMAIFRSMLKNGLITQQEYAEIDTKMLKKYRPLLGSIFSQNALINT